MFISKGHEKALRGRSCVGGPAYDFPSQMEVERTRAVRAVELARSRRARPPQEDEDADAELELYKKGTMGPAPKKWTNDPVQLARSLGLDPYASPGPTYKLPDPWEKLNRSPAKEAAATVPAPSPSSLAAPTVTTATFGNADRFFIKREDYKNLEYTRKDDSIQFHTGRSLGVGRNAYDKVIRPGWETEGQCKASPGIGPPMWSQLLEPELDEKKYPKEAPLVKQRGKFANAQRFPRSADETCSPGPGKYDRNDGCIQSPPQKPKKKTPVPSPSSLASSTNKIGTFGKKPVKPRFRPDLAMLCGKHGGWGYH